MQTGKEQFQLQMPGKEPCRAVSLSIGEGLFAFTTDAFMGSPPMIHVAKFEKDPSQQTNKTVLDIPAPKGAVRRVFWSDMNRTLVTAHEHGFVRKWDSEVRGCAGGRWRVACVGLLHRPHMHTAQRV